MFICVLLRCKCGVAGVVTKSESVLKMLEDIRLLSIDVYWRR